MKKIHGTRLKRFVFVLFFIVIAVLAGVLLHVLKAKKTEDRNSESRIGYEANIITDDADTLQDAVDKLYEKAEEGQMALQMKTEANSVDGKTFQCHLANSGKNNYEMYMVFYLDDTGQEIYRTGLIPIGGRIEEFTLEEALAPGDYEATIAYCQVEEDGKTIHAQVNVGLLLTVRNE